MKSNLRKLGILSATALASTMALVACGDDSGSEIFSMDESFEMVLEKAKYSFNKKDSTFKRIEPVCKEGTLGNLVGPDDTDLWDTLAYKVHEHKGVVTVKNGPGDPVEYNVEEGSFPTGFWADPDNDSQKIQGGFRLTKKKMMNRVIRYDGSCFMKDYYSLFRKNLPVLQNMNDKLREFYKSFLPEGAKFDDEQMLLDVSALNCEELSLYDALVILKLEEFKESSGKIKVSFDKRTCEIDFHLRYAYEQEDCQAAFDDYKAEKSKEKFDFKNYFFEVTHGGDNDDYCLDHLILELKEAKGIPTKNVKSADFARGVVNLMVGGLK